MSRQFTEQLTEGQAIAAANITTINSGGTASVSSSAINMGIMRRARAFFHLGSVTGGGAVTIALQSSATEAGSYANITLTGTAVVITGVNTANSMNAIEIRADQMPDGQPWLKAKATETGGHNVVVDIIVVADCASYSPGNAEDSVSWTNNVVGA